MAHPPLSSPSVSTEPFIRLVARWRKLQARANSLGWIRNPSPRVHQLAKKAGIEWWSLAHRVADFISLEPDRLIKRFGSSGLMKFHRLIEILEFDLKTQDQSPINKRWIKLQAKASLFGWKDKSSPFLHKLATKAGLKWYSTRSRARVADFISLQAHKLFKKFPEFSGAKFQRLIEILEAPSSQKCPTPRGAPQHSRRKDSVGVKQSASTPGMVSSESKDWLIPFVPRWEKLQTKARVLGWIGDGSPLVWKLAKVVNLSWYRSKSDRVADFLSKEADRVLSEVEGFGATKFRHLVRILESAIEAGTNGPLIGTYSKGVNQTDGRHSRQSLQPSIAQWSGWQIPLIFRWERLREKAADLGWYDEGCPSVGELAFQARLPWFKTRHNDRVSDFISLEAEGLFTSLSNFGAQKCQRLIKILEAASQRPLTTTPTQEGSVPNTSGMSYSDVLQSWEIPDDYPLTLIPLSARLMSFCRNQHITSLPALLEEWFKLGPGGMICQENIGRATVDELQSLVYAISRASLKAARRWLPIHDSGKGLYLPLALVIANSRHSETTQYIVALRLVDGLTLKEVGAEHNISRERVRQLESAYVRDIRNVVDWFQIEKETMLKAWEEGREWSTPAMPLPDSKPLILAAIESCFHDTPLASARRLAAQEQMHKFRKC